MELDAGISRRPCGIADPVPQVARLECLRRLAGQPRDEAPVAIALDRIEKVIAHPHRIVGILSGDRAIGFTVPVGVIGVERDLLVTLPRELDHPLDVVVGDHTAPRLLDGTLERRVLLDLEAVIARSLAIDARLHDLGEMLAHDLGAGDEGGDLLFLLHLPVDVVFDVGMIDVDHHHLGRPPGGAARFDGARRAIANLEEAHEARRPSAPRQLFAIAAKPREIGPGARAIFEEPRLAHPQIHDAALVHEVVRDRLDETGMRLGMLIGRFRPDEFPSLEIDIEVSLARPVDAVGPVEAGIEPLRGIWRAFLGGEHPAKLVMKGARVFLAREIAALPPPIGPGAGEPVEHLLGGLLAHESLLFGKR